MWVDRRYIWAGRASRPSDLDQSIPAARFVRDFPCDPSFWRRQRHGSPMDTVKLAFGEGSHLVRPGRNCIVLSNDPSGISCPTGSGQAGNHPERMRNKPATDRVNAAAWRELMKRVRLPRRHVSGHEPRKGRSADWQRPDHRPAARPQSLRPRTKLPRDIGRQVHVSA